MAQKHTKKGTTGSCVGYESTEVFLTGTEVVLIHVFAFRHPPQQIASTPPINQQPARTRQNTLVANIVLPTKTMKFHIKSSRRHRNRQRSNSQQRDDHSTPSRSSSIPSLPAAVPASITSSSNLSEEVVVPPRIRSCLRQSPAIGEPKQSSVQQQGVRFQEVHVREFEIIVGDNPSCSEGVPIGCVLAC